MSILLWPAIFLAIIFFNYEFHDKMECKRIAQKEQFLLEWNQLELPNNFFH